jgi:tetratricopeptide (TPR) repeat protein
LISRQYVQAHLRLGRELLARGDAEGALEHFEAAQATYPETLGERKHLLWPDADVHYYTGLARQALGEEAAAEAAFQRVFDARGGDVSEAAFYRALAMRAQDRDDEADALLEAVVETAQSRLAEQAEEGFATSIPEFVFAEADRETRRRVRLTYLIGLAHRGLGALDAARDAFRSVLDLDPGHGDARAQLRELR